MHNQQLVDLARERGADQAAVVQVADIRFMPEFRDACKANVCGKYGACWTCPPDTGEIDVLIEKAQGYEHALVFQTISQLEDPYDFEGMQEGMAHFQHVLVALREDVDQAVSPVLPLGAGSCQICETCTRPQSIPCRHPQKAIPSLESYGVAVSELARTSGMKYINGENTVTYFGAFLFDPVKNDA